MDSVLFVRFNSAQCNAIGRPMYRFPFEQPNQLFSNEENHTTSIYCEISDKFFSLFFFLSCFGFFGHAVDTYGLDNDDFNTEELDDAVADIQDTLEADNYEDQLPQPEVRSLAAQ